MFLWIVGSVCVLCLFSTAEGATSVSPCVNQYFEVKEGKTTNRLTCRGLTSQDTVEWFAKNSSAGSCPPLSSGSSSDSCTPTSGNFGEVFHPSRTSNAESVLNVDPVVYGSAVVERGGSLECRIAGGSGPFPSCQMDYVYPSDMGSCSVEFRRWSVVGSCSISKAYSAQGRYKCHWFQKTGSTETNFNLIDMTTSPLGGNYVRATCSLTTNLPTVAGSYSYRVVVTPGSVGKDVTATTTTVIALPQAPTVSCSPTGYVPENSTLSCTCNTATLGQPTGRLRWFWGTGNNINNNINDGNYGDTSLQMEPQKLVRGDDNRKKFRCDAEWATTVGGQVYTARVGYPPTGVTLQLTSEPQGATVSEGDNVTFACSGSGGQPTPTVTVVSKDSGVQLATGPSPLNHEENNVRCEDGGDYTCSADNRMGQPATTTATLYVNCKPRSNTTIPTVNFLNQSVSVPFDVTAYPIPNSLTFAFLGASALNISTPQTDYDGITLTGSCRQKGDKLYISTCTVTVDNMTSSAAAGFYQVTVANGQGQALFTVQIQYNAPEPPGNSPNTGGGVDAAAIGGGIVAAIVVIAVIVIAVIVVMRRRKGLNQKKPSSSFSAEHGRHAGGTPDPALPSPASSQSPLTDQPAAMAKEYVVVNKPKKKAVAVSVANGGQPDSTYAVVDKTKKKLALPAVGAKPKPKPKKGKGKKDVAGHVYINVELKPDKDKKSKKSAPPPPSPEESSTGREVNQDGLVYTSVDFKETPLPSAARSKPSPAEQGVVYSEVDFSKTAPTQ